MKIALIDYGSGNLQSAYKALELISNYKNPSEFNIKVLKITMNSMRDDAAWLSPSAGQDTELVFAPDANRELMKITMNLGVVCR